MEIGFVCYSIYFFYSFFFLQYSDINSYSVIDGEGETNLSHEARSIYMSVAHSVNFNNNFCMS